MKCKWLSDSFSEVCVNGECPVRGDFCPVTAYPEICLHAEFDDPPPRVRHLMKKLDEYKKKLDEYEQKLRERKGELRS